MKKGRRMPRFSTAPLGRLGHELRIALRSLRRAPGFTLTSVVILALGIGIATAIFTVLHAIIIRPLPEYQPERVALLRTLDAAGVDVSMLPEELKELRATSRTLRDVAGVAHQGSFATTLIDADRTVSLRAAWVTGNFFRVLGVRPVLGRFFTEEDEASIGTAGTMVLSYGAWQRDFGGDSSVLGRTLRNPYTLTEARIIGVAPPGLAYPVGTEYWSPQVYASLDVIARLAPSVTPEIARQDFFSAMRRIADARGGPSAMGAAIARADVQTLTGAVLGQVRPQLLALSAAVALLLLITCVNVGNLVLLRVTARHTEIAVRRSLGARTRDIVRPFLWESALLSLVGGALGLLLAEWLIGAFVRLAPPDVPRLDVLRLSGTPVAWAAALTMVTLVLAGVLPALAAMRSGVAARLRIDARAGGTSRTRRRVRQLLVSTQVALALVMLAGAGLVVKSLDRLLHVPLGYTPSHLAILTITRPVVGDSGEQQMRAMYELAAPRFRALRAVEAVTPVDAEPFYGPQVFVARWAAEGQPDALAEASPFIPWEVAGTEYFRTFRIPLIRGRGFEKTDVDGAPRVVVVAHAVAERYWPGENPIGKRLRLVGDTSASPWMTVVGEAGDIRYRTVREATPSIYVPWRQWFFQGIIAVRTTVPLESALPDLRRALRDVDPQARIARAQPMDALIDNQLALPRLSTLLLSALGGAALVLAAIGLYGVMAAAVREEAHDIGIRSALGATPGRLRAEVLQRAAIIVAAGGAAGIADALIASRFLRALLYQVRPTDPLALLGACGALIVVALVAAYVPAWRATRVDPMRVLRSE
ncbi:MAG TPA: ADOP family duplicated permease [Gemmatimonadaceae bacterium]|nr:ADOP family duplicated permease [Gemmatimonadaceae bacterium]